MNVPDFLVILPPPLISKPFPAPIYETMSNKVNFGAACIAALAVISCKPIQLGIGKRRRPLSDTRVRAGSNHARSSARPNGRGR